MRTKWKLISGASLLGLAAASLWGARLRPAERQAPAEDEQRARNEHGFFSRVPNFPRSMPRYMAADYWLASRALAGERRTRALIFDCGAGSLMLELVRQQPGLVAVGVDRSAEAVAAARTTLEQAGLDVGTLVEVVYEPILPFPDNSFDLVCSSHALHRWNDPGAVLLEVNRVLKPGGRFVLFDVRRDAPALLWTAALPVPAAHASFRAAYTPQEVMGILDEVNLSHWRVSAGPAWLLIEGAQPANAGSDQKTAGLRPITNGSAA